MPRVPPNPDSFRKNHFALLLNSLNSSGADPDHAQSLSRTGTMNASAGGSRGCFACLFLLAPLALPSPPSKIHLPPRPPPPPCKTYSSHAFRAVATPQHIHGGP